MSWDGVRGVPCQHDNEIDRSDDEFEAFLLELLSDFQISIPEIGTIKADKPPAVIITSNRTREIHDALKRRCLYFWIDYPSVEREYEIITARVPEVPKKLARQVSEFIGGVRRLDLFVRARIEPRGPDHPVDERHDAARFASRRSVA